MRGLSAHPDALIVAIARKGPRLLELLHEHDICPRSVWSRVTTEKAIPLLAERPTKLILVDDCVTFGSTFVRVVHEIEATVRTWPTAPQVICHPYAVGEGVRSDHARFVDTKELVLSSNEIGGFVCAELDALQTLGLPLDLEHPTAFCTLRVPLDPGSLRHLVEDIALKNRLESVLVKPPPGVTECLPDSGDRVISWSLFDPATSHRIRKLRVYWNPATPSLVVLCAMFPTFASLDTAQSSLSNSLLGDAWRVLQPLTCDFGSVQSDQKRSLIVLANYFGAIPLLAEAIRSISAVSELSHTRFPRREDLALLVGPKLANVMDHQLGAALRGFVCQLDSDRPHISSEPIAVGDSVFGIVPEGRLRPYTDALERRLDSAECVYDLIESVFAAQHEAIELPTRNETSGDARLDFGLTFSQLLSIVERHGPKPAPLGTFHAALDGLVDQGSIVPRYLWAGSPGSSDIVRVFRVGEGPLARHMHLARLAIELLMKALGVRDGAPATVFEKYLVLAFSGLFVDDARLADCVQMAYERRFHLYGARLAFAGDHGRFFLEATTSVIRRIPPKRPGEPALVSVTPQADLLYPVSESPWNEDSDVGDALADIAHFVANCLTRSDFRVDALVYVSTLATNEDAIAAIVAELDLWLTSVGTSIHRSLADVGAIVAAPQPDRSIRATEARQTLQRVANYTAQIREKLLLCSKGERILTSIDESITPDDVVSKRVWRRIRRGIDRRAGATRRLAAPELTTAFPTIQAAHRLAHRTTSLLRSFVSHVVPDERKESKTMVRALGLLLGELSDATSYPLLQYAADSELKAVIAIVSETLAAVPSADTTLFQSIRKVVLFVAEVIDSAIAPLRHRGVPRQVDPVGEPMYVIAWDVRRSTAFGQLVNERIDYQESLRRSVRRIMPNTGRGASFTVDDGNRVVVPDEETAVRVATVLSSGAGRFGLRIGIHRSEPRELVFEARTGEPTGPAVERASRYASAFREPPSSWEREVPVEPEGVYVIVGERARRAGISDLLTKTPIFGPLKSEHRFHCRGVANDNDWETIDLIQLRPKGQLHLEFVSGHEMS